MISFLMPRRANDDSHMWTPSWFGGGARTRAGVQVSEEIALTYSTVFLCTRIIAEPTAGMPVACYKRQSDGYRKLADKVNATSLITVAPNEETTAMPFREGRTHHQLNWGNGFSEIVRDPRTNEPIALWPIHPSRVQPGCDPAFPYEIRNRDGTSIPMKRDEILHITGTLSEDSIWGRGIIQQAREDIGYGLGMERHGGAYFGSGGQPKGIIIAPNMKSREDRRAFRSEFKEMHNSPDSAEIAILPSKDSSYTPITISNQDNQFLESRDWGKKQIANWYGVPMYRLGEAVPSGSIEALGTLFIMYTLYPWVRRQEEQMNAKLLRPDQRADHYFEHDFSSLLKGDIQTRMNAYRVGISTGIYTINHCRRLENLDGIGDAGDVNYVPANMLTAEAMARGESATRGPGSDHSGAPADNPLDHTPEMFDQWTRKQLTHIQRADLERQVKELQSRLSDRKTDWLEAAKLSLSSALKLVLTKESNAAQRASKGDLEAWVRTWYPEHEKNSCEALRPACATLRLAGVDRWADPADLAAWLRARNTESLLASYNSDSRETFARKLAAWPTDRANALTEDILQGRAA